MAVVIVGDLDAPAVERQLTAALAALRARAPARASTSARPASTPRLGSSGVVSTLAIFAILSAFLIVILLGFASATALTSATLLGLHHQALRPWLTGRPEVAEARRAYEAALKGRGSGQ